MMSGFMTLESDELFYINGGSMPVYAPPVPPMPPTQPEGETHGTGGSSK